jgi:hypothetical protein
VTHDELLCPRHHHEEQLHYRCVHEQLPSDSTTSTFVPSHPQCEEREPSEAATHDARGGRQRGGAWVLGRSTGAGGGGGQRALVEVLCSGGGWRRVEGGSTTAVDFCFSSRGRHHYGGGRQRAEGGCTAAAPTKEGDGSSSTATTLSEGGCIAEAFSCEARWESVGRSVEATRMPILRCRPNTASRRIVSVRSTSGIRLFGSPQRLISTKAPTNLSQIGPTYGS